MTAAQKATPSSHISPKWPIGMSLPRATPCKSVYNRRIARTPSPLMVRTAASASSWWLNSGPSLSFRR